MKRADAPEALCIWDTETSGVDIENDRILTVYGMVQSITGEILDEIKMTIDPGIEIPKGASDVHGMSTEYIREHGRKDDTDAIMEVANWLIAASATGYPIVGYNNSYDLGILDRELIRHSGEGLSTSAEFRDGLYFDPIIYDRANDKYRKGGRKLMDVAKHYGITLDESRLHEAEYDVIVTADLAWRILKKSPWTLPELQPLQKSWKADWAKHLTEYFASQGKTENGKPIVVDGSFPWKLSESA